MPPVPSTDVGIRITGSAVNAFTAFDKLNNKLALPTANLAKLNLQFRGLDRLWTLIAVGSGAALIKTFVGMAAELQKTQFQLAALTNDLAGVPRTMNRIIDLTERVPFTLNTMTNSFVRLKAAGLDPIVDDQGNGPLKDLADAVAAFGGGEEIFKRATIAIQQMAGKGVISMEELRQQLGEAVPVAMRVMAEQMGLSVSRFITEVSRGEVEFERGITALFEGFRAKFGGAGELLKSTFTGQLQQTRLEFEKLSKVLVLDSGALDVLTAAIQVFNSGIRDVGTFLSSPEGNEAIGEFQARLVSMAGDADRALNFISDVGGAIAGFGAAIASLIGNLPPEVLAGGLIGFILFSGRSGIGLGLLLGAVSTVLQDMPSAIGGFVQDVLNNIPEEIQTAGVLGFIFFGRIGKIIGLAILAKGTLEEVGDFAFAFIKAVAQTAISDNGLIGLIIFGKGKDFDEKLDNAFSTLRTRTAQNLAIMEETRRRISQGQKSLRGGGVIVPLEGILGTPDEAKDQAEKVASGAVTGFINKLNELIPKIRATREQLNATREGIKDIGGLTPQELTTLSSLGTFMERLERQASGAGTQIGRFNADLAQKLGKLDGIISNVNKRIATLGEGDTRVAGLRKEIEDLTAQRGQIEQLGKAIVDNLSGRSLEKVEEQVGRLKEQFDVFLRGSTPQFDLMAEAVQRVEARFAGFQLRINQLTRSVIDSTVAGEDQARVLELLEILQNSLNKSRENSIRLVKEAIKLKQDEKAADFDRAAGLAETGAELLRLENEFDKVGIAVLRANERINTMLDRTRRQIEDIQKAQTKGLITKEAGDATIARLQAVNASIEEQSQKFIERAAFNASEFGQLMNSVASSLEDAFADSILSLVNKTKTLKDVMIDFYDEITAAVARFLAKQALMQVFGQKGGFGQALGGILTPFGNTGLFGGVAGSIGKILSFAGGGSMIVGGSGGTDSQLTTIRTTPGERVDVTAPGMPRAGTGGFGETGNIIIQALDGNSVRDLFMREGSSLMQALDARRRLNR